MVLSKLRSLVTFNAKTNCLDWDLNALSKALKIPKSDVKNYFSDGRRVSFILERRLAREFFKGRIAKSEGADFDIVGKDGSKWEVRSITASGVYFCPSYMVGSGRSFNKKGFLSKLSKISGYVLCDVSAFPSVPFWIIPSGVVRSWWNAGTLGKTTKISRKKALTLLEKL